MNRIFLLFPLIIICFRFISGFKTVRCPALVLKTRFGRLNSIDANGAAKDEILGKTENDFIVNIESDVTEEEISNLNLIKIVNLEATDLQCNQLCWKCLGYLYDPSTGDYDNSNVFPKWREKYPNPPDVIGMKRIYSPDVDKPVRDASIALMRSIPRDFKGGVRSLEKDGFRGFKLKELTPNKTRRAQV